MAEEGSKQAEAPPAKAAGKPKSMMPWLVLWGVVALLAGGVGIFVGKLVPKTSQAAVVSASAPAPHEAEPDPEAKGGHGAKKDEPRAPEGEVVYLDFEPIIVNLDEPRLARYVRAAVVLSVRRADKGKAKSVIEEKKPEIKNYLTVYMSGCSLEDVRGPKNLNRIRREIQDALNRHLFGDNKPLIEEVLFKEFAIQ